MALMRLQKFLSASGVCSRRKGEELITGGRVTVNGRVADVLGTQVDAAKDDVRVDGRKVGIKEENIYIALNKPVNVESTCRRGTGRIILDLLDLDERVYPVGRLDKDSEGLILLTSDGRIHHALSHPSFQHEKEYVVTVGAALEEKDLKVMAGGMDLGEFKTRPCRVKRLSGRTFRIVLKEGKNRQIRKMAEAVGHRVVMLKRVRIGKILLGNLKPGEWRHLSAEEVDTLLSDLGFHSNTGHKKPRRDIQ
jgi:23S rRNA pseudouridine2605 synthase/23S rRNA pseudouridine2604 synthase